MPGMSGQELVAVISRIYPHPRLLMMSGIAGPATAQGGHVRILPPGEEAGRPSGECG